MISSLFYYHHHQQFMQFQQCFTNFIIYFIIYFHHYLLYMRERISINLLFLLIITCLIQSSLNYTCNQLISWGSINGWGACYQASNTNCIGDSMGSLSDCQWQCGNWDLDYNNGYYAWISVYQTNQWGYGFTVYRPCHNYCASCSSSWNWQDCTSCHSGYYRSYMWSSWPASSNVVCHTSCPNRQTFLSNNNYPGQYLANPGDYQCTWCNSLCSGCQYYTGGSVCYTCVSSAYLIQNHGTCITTFPDYAGSCYNDNQCISPCPALLYFPLGQGSTSSATYSWSANNANSYVRQSNLCYLCHPYCIRCWDQYTTTCYKCRWSEYLTAFNSLCTSTFNSITNLGTYPCSNNNKCLTGCPADLYFPLPQASTTSANYPTTANSGSTDITGSNICYLCHYTCRRCTDNTNTTCQACTSNSYLVYNNAQCLNRFPGDSSYCKANRICYQNNCPNQLYFKLAMASTTAAKYAWTALSPNTQLNKTNLCFLCNRYCLTCTDNTDTSCTSCSSTFFKWTQSAYSNRCNYFCNQGTYSTTTVGQYINPTTSYTTRTCAVCSSGCVFCASSASTCYICQDTYYLLDDKASCQSTYTCKQCKSPANGGIVTDGCATIDKYCRISTCPAFFYFTVYSSWNGGVGDTLVTNPKYDYFTNASTLDPTLNGYQWGTARTTNSTKMSPSSSAGILYRRLTNLCKLCDFRCIQCTGPSNFNCSVCVNNYYKWTTASVCESYCPTGQYQLNISASYPDNQTKCGNCDPRCIACIGYNNNCTSCQQFPGANYAYLYNIIMYNSTCMNSCPTSTNPLTNKGYYGSIASMVCYACPGFCSNCNMNYVVSNYALLQTIACGGGDNYCLKGVICTDCLQGYSLVGGTCVGQSTCKQYSYYLKGISSSSWSPTNCYCMDGYYFSSYLTCSHCDLSCLTCNGPNSNNCLTCDQGYKLSSTSCVQNLVKIQDSWLTSGTTVTAPSGQITSNNNVKVSCGTYYTLFGFRNTYSKTDYMSYSTPTISTSDYYAISFKLTVLFIDNWDSTSALFFRLNSATVYPSFTYNYDNKGAMGEQQCGTNAFDYLLTISGKINVAPTNNNANTIYISSNVNPIQNTSGFYYMWGIKDAVFTVLKCHSDCASCTGPAANQCKTCASGTKIINNGSCICNSASQYFYDGSTSNCIIGCPICSSIYGNQSTSCYYRDYSTSRCVNPPITNCTAPNSYGHPFQITNSYGQCVQNCSSGYFSVPSLMKCTSNCAQFKLYHYNGSSSFGSTMKSCQSICPNGMIANPFTYWCVLRCPTNYYLLLQNRTTNPTCTDNCPTGYEYDNDNTCVLSCPVGYFTQLNSSSHNKCVQKCTATFGDNITSNCVSFCPTPSIADPTTNLCVKECPFGYYLQVAKLNGNRTCVTQCQTAQWLHPFYLNCSSNPKDCPLGTYADNSTHKCEYNCTVLGQVGQNSTQMCQTSCYTGYAYWNRGLCVSICPTNPSMFGFINGSIRICVSSCNSTTTGLYGDVQANRTCTATCSQTPQSTFGNNGTNLCVKTCPVSNQYGDPNHPYRQCVTICSTFPNQTFSYYVTKLCVDVCPVGYYGDNYTTSHVGICALGCPNGYYGDPISNLCVVRCPYRYFGSQIGYRPCVTTCPTDYYGINSTTNRVCVTTCDTGYWADNYTRLCYNVKTMCSNSTYADATKKLCVVGTNCTKTTYADPLTMGCQTTCSNSSYFGDPSSNLCVTQCPLIPDYYSQSGYCTATCSGGKFADWQANRTCVTTCSTTPIPLYGTATFRCVNASQCGALGLFGNNNIQLCSACSGTLPFGDPISKQCVSNCPNTYYGDKILHLCVLTCDAVTPYYADNLTNTCNLMCSLGTFGVNSTLTPVCQEQCPPGSYALDTTRVCVINCGTGFFGDPLTGKCFSSSLNCSIGYYGNSVTNMCVLPASCQTVSTLHYYADNDTKMCISKCTSPNYCYNTTWVCVGICANPLFGQNTTRMCIAVTSCGLFLSFADKQNNLCVSVCSVVAVTNYTGSVYAYNDTTYAENVTYTCVTPQNCPNSRLAQNNTQSCVTYCPYNSTYYTYADPFKTHRCLAKCFDIYYGQISSGHGLCTDVCPGLNYFRDNLTQLCVYECPSANASLGWVDTYGDNTTDMCVQKCPVGYFAQIQVNRTCVQVCQAGTWGNLVTRMCITNPVADCPSGTWADNFTNLCVSSCNSNSSNSQLFYGQNITKMCKPSCPVPSFAYNPTRVCIDICPVTVSTFPGLFGDPTTTPTRLCVPYCVTVGLYRDVANNRTCQPSCTYNATYKTYRDPTTMTCQAECPTYPQYLYAWSSNSTNAQCVSTCPTGYMYDDNMSCISSCPNLLDPTTNRCYSQCPFNSYSNTTLYANTATKQCVTASNCPNNTYASDDLLQCVTNCPNNTYIYQKYCISFCPDGLFINSATTTCVAATGCPTNYFGNNQTRTCVASCTNGTFGDATTRMCLTQCYGTNYADPLTGLCSSNCSAGLIKNSLTLTCVGNCQSGLFYNSIYGNCSSICTGSYFADSQTNTCVLKCTSDPMTFSSITPVRACVTVCPSSAPWFDLINRACVSNCTSGTYQYSLNISCVSFCPPPYYQQQSACVLNCSSLNQYADDISRTCLSICPTGYFRDPTTYKCVINCPKSPVQYYASITSKNCQTGCVNTTYADIQKGACVSQCSTDPLTYAQPNSHKCVVMCPAGYSMFADPVSQKCVTKCQSGYFADNRQRKCLKDCGKLFYADSNITIPSCVSKCSAYSYADPLTYKCSTSCSLNYYIYVPNNTCLQFCPYTYFADPSTGYCVVECRAAAYQYADNLTHLCTSKCTQNQYAHKPTSIYFGVCLYYCPNGYFSDPTTMTCVIKCPQGYFGETTNNTCSLTCHQSLFKDSINNLCQSTCPSANNLFGQPFSRECVTICNKSGNNFLFADTSSRICTITCSGSQFGDPQTLKCVTVTGCTFGTYSDPYYKMCVNKCYNQTYSYGSKCLSISPLPTLYADQLTQSWVAALNCTLGTYADPTKQKCVPSCDIASGLYANEGTRKCETGCTPLFADNITRSCVSTCTSVPQYYAHNTSKICVQNCPINSFGDPTINICVLKCSNGSYGNPLTWTCVIDCPQLYFADNSTNTCVKTCPSTPKYFGDYFTRSCVFNCSKSLYADSSHNRQCHSLCLPPLYAQNSTYTCLPTCLTGYANPRTQQCIATCTKGYYGYSKICYQYQCPPATPMVFADDSTNLCVTKCPNGTYGQPNTLKCVKICPISNSSFADTVNNVCTPVCSGSTFADASLRTCVTTCSANPSLYSYYLGNLCVSKCPNGRYADNLTRSCETGCSGGRYADNSTYTCVTYCPTSPMMWAQNITYKCVFDCSVSYNRFADNSSRSCVKYCPNHTFADPTSRSCVQTCPSGYFGVNTTWSCQLGCTTPYFADSLIRLCVSQCSVDPIYYGEPNTHTCINQCPDGSYGNPLTQQCVANFNGTSTCPTDYYADPTTQLCVQMCPMKQNLYAEPYSKICQSSCISPYISDNSTMKCVTKCPTYPAYFSSNGHCVKYCPNGTYADNLTRVCVTTCPNQTYAENSTWRCVSYCPNNPISMRDPFNWICVAQCPPSSYSDMINLLCVTSCTLQSDTFARVDTRVCVKVCPNGTFADVRSRLCLSHCVNLTYADNSTRKCVPQCPRYPPLYANTNNNSMTCVSLCPLGLYSFEDTRQCLLECPPGFYRQNSTSACVSNCNYTSNTYADDITKYCVLICSNGTFADFTTSRCVTICPNQPLMYAENTTKTCVTVCPDGSYGDNITRTCVEKCPSGSLSLNQTHLCLFECPNGYYAYEPTQFCIAACVTPYYGDPSTRSCVLQCPLNQLLFADNSTRTCVYNCPSGSYAYQWSVACLPSCPIVSAPMRQTFAAFYDNTCVQQCAYPFYSHPTLYKCISSCPDPFFNNLEAHQCSLCPSSCSSCTGLSTCKSCVIGYYLQNGACVSNCSLIYYANTFTRTCVISTFCMPNYGINSTHTCSSSCPLSQFANPSVYRCDACPSTCISCTSWANCLSCITNSVSYNNYCYGYCNPANITEMYFNKDNITCTATCPIGTYASVIYCKLCDAVCSSCFKISTNCTGCSNGLYLLNGACMTSCPSGYKPNSSLNCIFCNTTCGQGLTYNTNVTNINGQTAIYMNFNSQININGNIYNTISINTNGRRLQSGVPAYQIIVIDAQTIQIIFAPGASASSLNVQIINPQNIQDSAGNLPAQLASQILLDLSNIYSSSINQVPNSFPIYFTFLAIICVISFLFDLQMMKFLQLIYIHYFVAINLPPILIRVFSGLRYSTLYYLPRFFEIEAATLKKSVPDSVYNAIGDYNFLRNAGFAFTPLAVILFIWAALKLLSVPEINRFKVFRVWCHQLLENKFKYAVILEWVAIFMLNTLFFAFLQLRDYNIYDQLTQVSLILAHLFILVFVIVFVLVLYRIVSFYRQYPSLASNLKKATELILKDQQVDQLVSTNIFLSEKKKIDLRNLHYPKINNQNIFPFRMDYRYNIISVLCSNVVYLRAILLSMIIALAKTNIILQMALAIPLNILCLLYFSKARPYSFKFRKYRIRNYFAIYHQVCLIVLEFLMLAIGMIDKNKGTAAEKQKFAYYIVYYLTVVCSVTLLYQIFTMTVFIYRKVWLIFIQSDIFRRNFPEKYAKYQAAKLKNVKIAKSIDPKAKEALRNLIKGYKKNKSVLRPNDSDKLNPQLPMKYKITYFDKTQNSSASSKTTLSKTQKRQMLKEIFNQTDALPEREPESYEEVNQATVEPQYEEYEQQIEINAKDLSKYVANADQLMKAKKGDN